METVIENATEQPTETAKPKSKRAAKATAKDTPKPAAKPTKKAAKAKPAVEAKPSAGKSATIQTLIGRKNGATLSEIMAATGWQAHSVRGFIATFNKKNGGAVASSKNAQGERVYKIS